MGKIWVTAHPLKKLLKENIVTQAINARTKRICHGQLIFQITCAEIHSINNGSLHPLHMSKQQKGQVQLGGTLQMYPAPNSSILSP